MQRVLDPAQIEAFAQRSIPRIRLPDSRVFADRAARLRKLSEAHAIGDYLRLMAVLCDAQHALLTRLSAATAQAAHPESRCDPASSSSPASSSNPGSSSDPAGPAESARSKLEQRIQLARAHGMPLLQASGSPRDPSWRGIVAELCTTIAASTGFPAAVAATCRRVQALPAGELEQQADGVLSPGSPIIDAQAAPFVMAALQVHWVHQVRSLTLDMIIEHVASVDVPGVCPVCGTLPVASIVRADKAYQGYRYLHCGLCETEWHLVRIKCSQCLSTEGIHYYTINGATNEGVDRDKTQQPIDGDTHQTVDPTTNDAASAAVRAEACDRCRSYRKIVYPEHDPEVEPVADDLASLALDLLMAEDGFHRASGHPLLWQPV